MVEVKCPRCGAPEECRKSEIHLRVNKICTADGTWMSQCLVCSGGYDQPFGTFDEKNHKPNLGWFATNQ